jgi:hypothetical protein
MPQKYCVLLLVDALSHDVVRSLVDLGKLPGIQRLVAEGGKLSPCLSIFPSITPAATCSIMTGDYPKQHGIEGACWLDRDNGEIAYYGDDVKLAIERGFYDYVFDFGDRLNFERLQSPTLFEQLHAQGIDSLSVNSMWFAGPHEHRRATPLALKLGVGTLPETVRGPKYMKLGSFVESLPEGVPSQPAPTIFNRYGFQDQITIDTLLAVAKAGKLTPMTVGYLPENDDIGHTEGLRQAADTALIRFDKFLREFVETLGGWDRVGRSIEIVIVGDHSQVEFGDRGAKIVCLDKYLDEFDQAKLGSGWTAEEQIFICPNMRSAAIYLRRSTDHQLRDRVIERMLQCDGVDLLAYESNAETICVRSPDRGSLRFGKAQQARGDVADDYGNEWFLKGDLTAVGLVRDGENRVKETDYPNPLERLWSAFVPGSAPIWVSARTDTEFVCDGHSSHDGGSHASLHRVDSVAALITSSGIDHGVIPNPDRPRIVDVAALCHEALRLAPSYAS